MSVKKDTINGVKWTAFERISMQLMQFIIGVILARILSPSDFGIVGMMTIFITFSNTFIDSGFSSALIRKLDCNEDDYSTALFFNILIGITIYGILFLTSPYLATFFKTPILADLLKILACVVLINSFSIVQIAKLSREINFKVQANATFFSVLVSGIFGILLAYSGFGVWALVWQQIASASIKTILIWIYAKWLPKMRFSKASFKHLFGYGSKILLSNLIGTLYNQFSTIIIGKFYTPIDLGYYTRGQQFAHLPTVALTDILGKVTFPILSRYQNEDETLVNLYRKYISITSMVIFFFLMMLAALAKPIILLLLSEKWACSIIYLQIFCMAFLFEHISKLNLNILQVKGRSDLYLRLEIIKKLFAFGIMIASVPLGIVAICLSTLVYSQISLVINTYYTGKLFNLGFIKQLKDFFKYLLFSFIACIPSLLVTYISIPNVIQIFIGVTSAVGIYYLLLRNDNYFCELKNDIKHKLLNRK